jgi:hypothetical protein
MLKFDFDGMPLDPQQAPSSRNSVLKIGPSSEGFLRPGLKGCHANISMVSVALPTMFPIGEHVAGCGIAMELGGDRFQLHQLNILQWWSYLCRWTL